MTLVEHKQRGQEGIKPHWGPELSPTAQQMHEPWLAVLLAMWILLVLM